MPCYHPLTAFRTAGGDVVFREVGDIVSTLSLPCGRCVGCRLERSRMWATRVMHEAALQEDNCFITLTYDDDHLPDATGKWYRDFQLFLKRLRKLIAPSKVRFFCAGEYGEDFDRPHFHAALFGVSFGGDRTYWKKSPGGFPLYRSATLEGLWSFGFSSVGDLSFESAGYIARYVMKKVNGDRADEHYKRVDVLTGEVTWLTPEFVFMSLKPGIGARWFEKFGSEVFPVDRVISRGVPCKPPRYYDYLMRRKDVNVIDEVKMLREQRARERGDNSNDRLRVKELVAEARVRQLRRSLK